MAKPSKDARPEPRLPKGLREAAELRQQQEMLGKIRAVYERSKVRLFGFNLPSRGANA
jgi:hypothetical protein